MVSPAIPRNPHSAVLKRCIYELEGTSAVYQATVRKFGVDENMLFDQIRSVLESLIFVVKDGHSTSRFLREGERYTTG